MSLKAMVSQPMAGKSEEEILATRDKAVAALKAAGYEVVDTYFDDEWYARQSMQERGVENIPLYFLAKSFESMAGCHTVYFCKGWEDTRGCRAEHRIAKEYGIKIIYEEQPEAEFSEAEHTLHDEKRYATAYWTAEDLMSDAAEGIIGTKLSREEAEALLEDFEEILQSRMIEAGWDIIDFAVNHEEQY